MQISQAGRSASRTTLHAVIGFVLLCAATAHAADTAPPEKSGVAWRETVQKFAAEHFRNPAWGYSHAVRDYRVACELAAADHIAIDDDVMFAAAYLHDVAAFPPWANPKVDHADIAADLVESVLGNAGFPMIKLGKVRGAIRTHMFDREPSGPEALYLHDADALDWLGAIGVARIMSLVDPAGGEPTGPKVIPMLESNLEKVPSRVLSPGGRARVPVYRAELAGFLRDLRRESADLSDL